MHVIHSAVLLTALRQFLTTGTDHDLSHRILSRDGGFMQGERVPSTKEKKSSGEDFVTLPKQARACNLSLWTSGVPVWTRVPTLHALANSITEDS